MKRVAFIASLIGALLVLGAAPALALEPDEVAAFDPSRGEWFLRDSDGGTSRFFYGIPADEPMLGDWDCDGVDTVGMFRRSNGFVYLRNSNDLGIADQDFFYGQGGDIPLVGDWNGDGCDTLAIYRQGEVFVRNSLGTGVADYSFFFGNPGDRPFSGDFDGDGVTTVGLYRVTTGLAYFTNENKTGVAEFEFFYGVPSDKIIAGDWDGDGADSVGIFRPTDGRFYLSNQNAQVQADTVFSYGDPSWVPVAGHHQQLASSLAIDSSSLDFGRAGINVASTRSIGASFVGEFDDPRVTVKEITFVGPDASLFSGSATSAVRVGPGGRFSADVSVVPDRLGPISATMQIRHSGQNSPMVVEVTAEGVYRVNAGGPGDIEGWLADNPISPYVSGTTAAFATPGFVGGSSVPAGLFDTYRFGAMEWEFPVTPGRYTVNLYFAETFGAGSRIFDVSIEGGSVLTNFDVVAAAGGQNRAVSRSFTVQADGVIDLDFFPTSGEPPLVNAIEIQRVPEPGKLGAVPTSIDFGSVATGGTAQVDVTLVNLGTIGDPVVSISDAFLTGTTGPYQIIGNPPASLAPGVTATIAVAFSPSSEAESFASLNIANSGGQISVPLRGRGNDVIVYRINAGGPALSGTLPWADGRNLATGLTSSVGTAGGVAVDGASLPLGTSPTVFLTEQFGTDMQWDFGVDSGTYEVRLYLAERFHNAAGARRFNVTIEGTPRNNIDIFSLAGGKDIAVMLPTVVNVTDGNLDINFARIVDQATVQGIEVVRVGGPAGLRAEPSSFNFGKIAVGATATQTVRVVNSSDVRSVQINGTSLGGSGAFQFAVTNLSTTLAPGRSRDVTVQFRPTTAGEKAATVNVSRVGAGPILSIPLAGVGNASPILPPPGLDPFTVLEEEPAGTVVTTVTATDPDDTSFTYEIISGTGSSLFSIGPASGVITTTAVLDFETATSYTLLVRAQDPLGAFSNVPSYTIAVTAVNEPPILDPITDRVTPVGPITPFSVPATDPDVGDVLRFEAAGLPPGLSISPAGEISGTIGAGAVGPYLVDVTVFDRAVGGQDPLSDTKSFTWTIDKPPTVTVPASFSVPAGGAINTSATFADDRPGASATVTGAPAWLTFSSPAASPITFTGPAPASPTSATVTVTATDSAGQQAAGTFTITVTPNSPPTVNPIVAPATNEDDPIVGFSVTATDAENDTPITFAATGLPVGVSLSQGGVFSGSFAEPGSYPIAVRATDPFGTGPPRNFTWVVADVTPPAGPLGLTAGTPTQTTVQLSWSASSDNVGVVGYRIYQDAPVVLTSPVASTTGATTVSVNGLTAGTTYTFRVEAYDQAGNQSSGGSTVGITTNSPPTVDPIVAPATNEDDPIVGFSVTATDAENDTPITFAATGLPVGVSLSQGGVFSGSFAEPGSYPIAVRATDPFGTGPPRNFTWVVADVTPPTPPGGLAAGSVTQTTVELTWSASSDNVGVVGYRIYQDTPVVVDPVASTTGATTVLVEGLTAGNAYTFRVEAYDLAGNQSSGGSTVATATLP